MKDRFGREITYLRLSVTDRCNQSCFYCHSPSVPFIPHNDILRYEEMGAIVEVLTRLGIRKVRITGGEPLVRKGLSDLVCNLVDIKGLETVALTTNGTLLSRYLSDLYDAGLRRINVSLDSPVGDTYRRITRSDYDPSVVLDAVREAKDMGFSVKLNSVLTATSFKDAPALIETAKGLGVGLRFIELMPIGLPREVWKREHISPELLIEQLGLPPPIPSNPHNGISGPATTVLRGKGGFELGIIAPISVPFCQWCNRIRIEADGKLRPCLSLPKVIDLKPHIGDVGGLKSVLRTAIYNKPERHSFGTATYHKRGMNRTGG